MLRNSSFVLAAWVLSSLLMSCGPASGNCLPQSLATAQLETEFTLPKNSCWSVDGILNVSKPLTVESGVVVTFLQDSGLRMTGEGRLEVKGTDQAPVLFTGAEKTAGFWRGLTVETSGSANAWSHLTIEYAGSKSHTGDPDTKAAVFLPATGSVALSHVTIQHSAWYAVAARSTNTGLQGFAENSFKNNVRLMRLHPNLLGQLDGASVFADNAENKLRTPWNNGEEVSTAQTWPALSAPYLLVERVTTKATLTLAPGTRVESTQDGWLQTQATSAATGALTAEGTAENPIVFTGDDVVTGYWRGVGFDSVSSANRLTHVRVEYAGSKTWTGDPESKAAVYVSKDGSVAVSHIAFVRSGGHGIYVGGSGALTCQGATFQENTSSAVYLDATDAALSDCP